MDDWENGKVGDQERTFGFLVRSVKNLLDLLQDKRNAVLGLSALLVFCQILALIVPYCLKLIFDVLPEVLREGRVDRALAMPVAAYIILQLSQVALLRLAVKWPMFRIIIYLENHWPCLAQARLLELQLGYHERENTGKKISKIEKGCEKMLQLLFDLFWTLLPQGLYLVINLIFLLCFDWRLGLILAVPVIVSGFWVSKSIESNFTDWAKWESLKERSSGFLCQSLINVRTVQGFVQEQRETQRFNAVRSEMRELDYVVSRKINRNILHVNLFLNCAFILCVLFAIYLAFQQKITVGTIIFIITTGSVSIQSVISIVEMYNQCLRKFVTVNRLKSLLDEVTDIENRGEALPAGEGTINIDEISFVYPNKTEPVLKDFSLKIEPQKMVALVAKSGEGKTTLARLIARMYDVTSGAIRLDGRDIRELDLYDYRRQFAIVQQDVDIFDGTLRDNVVYPHADASPAAVDEALRAAYLHLLCEDKERMPNGIDTQVGERGVKLSGGERQRVGIARAYIALLHGARFLILDEATSNLDSEAERAIQEMIGKLRDRLNITIIVIAHRLSTIQLADQLCVINDGRVEELGDHSKLMKQNGLYSSLVELQRLGSLRD